MDVSLSWETCKGFLECTNFVLGTDVFRNVSFLFGVLVAIVSVLSAKAIARKKQAADLLFNSRGMRSYRRGCVRWLKCMMMEIPTCEPLLLKVEWTKIFRR